MAIIDRIKSLFTETKAQAKVDQNITGIPNYNEYKVSKRQNYIEQFYGYTYKAIDTIANALIPFEPILYKRLKSGDPQVVKNNDLLADLYRFNDFLTFSQARQLTTYHRKLVGNAYWLMAESENSKHKIDFFILDPERISIKTNDKGLPETYVYRDTNGKQSDIDPMDLIVFTQPDPGKMIVGMSTLEAARYAHNAYELIRQAQINQFGNLMPKGALIIKGISEDNRQRAERIIYDKYGGVKNNGKTPILNQETEWLNMGMSNKELDFEGSISDVRDEILSLFGVPKPLVGLTDSTYANAKEAQRVFQTITLRSELNIEKSIFNEQLLPKYFKNAEGLYFDFKDPVEIDIAEISNSVSELFKNNIITRAEAKKRIGMTINETDDIYFADIVKEPASQETDDKSLADIKNEITKLNAQIKTIPDIKERLEDKRTKLKEFYYQKNLEQESRLVNQIDDFFVEQAKRAVSKLDSVRLKFLNQDKEADLTVEFFRNAFASQYRYWNELANSVVGENRKITENALKELEKDLQKFSNELNKTTINDLNKVLAKAVKEDFDLNQTKKEVANIFNKYIDGSKNKEILQRLGVYVDKITVNEAGQVVEGSQNRLNRMFELIKESKMSEEDQKLALRALRGTVKNPTSPLATSIDSLLERLYGSEPFEKITTQRAETIARTEVNRVKNAINRDIYFNTPYVEKIEWLSAKDSSVRSYLRGDAYDHVSADGQLVPKGAKFRVSNQWLKYPGDSNGDAGNVINCRCTIIPVVEA